MSRRVAFTGAQGVGKTTLVAAVSEKLKARSTVAVLEGLGASVAALGVPVGEGATTETLMAFAELHLRRERLAQSAEFVLQDRCFLDLLAYARATRCDTALYSLLSECAAWSLRRIVHVYYVPIEPFSAKSLVSRESDQFKIQVADAIQQEATRLGVELQLVSVSVEARAALVVDRLLRL